MTSSAPSPQTAHGIHAVVFLGMLAGLYALGATPSVMAETHWWRPFLVIHLGVFAGNLVMGALARRDDSTEDVVAAGRRQDLEDNRAIVVRQLRNLETERHKMSDEDYEREHAALLSVGAEALRALEEGDPVTDPTPTDATPEGSVPALVAQLRAAREADPEGFDAALGQLGLSPASDDAGGLPDLWKGALGTLVLVAVVAALFVGVSQDARQRVAGAPMTGGDSAMRGEAPPPGAAAPAPGAAADAVDPRLQALRQQAEADPTNIDLWNQLTELALAMQDMGVAMEANMKALELDAADGGARTFKAVLLAFIGQRDQAEQALTELVTEDPTLSRAWVYKGLLALESDPAAAVEALEKALALDDNPQVRQALAEARARASAPPPTVLAQGTITLAEGAATEGRILFVSARRPAGGPPLAALRLEPGPFPMDFELTSADLIAMGGGTPSIPEAYNLSVRLDTDGDPMSRPDTDPSAVVEGLAPGATELTVTLQ